MVLVYDEDNVKVPCVFRGGDSFFLVPDWRIVRRSDDGSIASNEIISGSGITRNLVDNYHWVPDHSRGQI